jgi:4-amino-4-deoxy-L-arabinose transferase-like glycosyltransferase
VIVGRVTRSGCLAPFGLAIVARIAYLAAARPPFQSEYWSLADGLLHNGSLAVGSVATTHFEPLYPIFLAASRAITGDRILLVQVVEAIVASLAVMPLYRLTASITGRPRAAAIATTIYAVYPLLIRHAVDGTETALLSTLLVAFASAFVAAQTAGGAAAAGLWLGLAGLTRAVTWPLILVAPFIAPRRDPRLGAIVALVAALVISPYVIRNLMLNGSSIPTRAGVNLFISNSRYTAMLMPRYGPDLLGAYSDDVLARERVPVLDDSPDVERRQDAAFRALTRIEVATHPWTILWLKIRNAGYFFAPWLVPYYEPTPEASLTIAPDGTLRVGGMVRRSAFNQTVYVLSYGSVLAFALLGLYQRRRQLRADAILWCVVAAFTGAHVVFFPTTRYRAPVDFVLMIYAATALDAVSARRMRSGA